MKQLLAITMCAVMVVTLFTGCSQDSSTQAENGETVFDFSNDYPFHIEAEDLPDGGSMSTGLKLLSDTKIKKSYFPAQYNYYSDTSGDLYLPFTSESGSGYKNQHGEIMIRCSYSTLGNFSDGFAFCDRDVINTDGKVVFTLPEGVSATTFKNGGAVMMRRENDTATEDSNDKNVYICLLDKNMQYQENKVQLPKGTVIGMYDSWYTVNERGFQGLIGFFGNRETGRQIGIVNAQGNMIACFDGEKAFLSAKDNFSFINFSNSSSHARATDLSDTDLTKIIFFKNGYMNVMDANGKWGLMSLKTGTMELPYSFDYVGAYSDGLVPVCSYGKWGTVNLKGEYQIPCKEFLYIGSFTAGKALAIDSSEELCVIDRNGEVIARPEVTISNSNLTGTHKSIYYTDFTEDTHIACVWLWEHVSLISDTGEVLLATSIPERATINEFLYMNHDYVYVRTKDEERIYQILK